MTWPILANLLILVGVLLQLAGLIWAVVALWMSWRRNWPRERLLPPWVHRLMFGEKDAPPGPVYGDSDWGKATVTLTAAPTTLEGRLAALTERVLANEKETHALWQHVGNVERDFASIREKDIAHSEQRAKDQVRAGIIGAPILIIVGTALQMFGPILGFSQ